MACNHKFLNQHGLNGLIPSWNFDKLIIGTFNPENLFHPQNNSHFFYQRPKNYFWDVFPSIYGQDRIDKLDTQNQLDFLVNHYIGITDILISIVDAEHLNAEHIELIQSVRDNEIELFNEFVWNTDLIISSIIENNVSEVYFTKLGSPNEAAPPINSFEHQFRIIEDYCNHNNIINNRLHSPTGMGLGHGPRIPTLRNRWIQNGIVLHNNQ
jgi:hypothetical protein